MKAKKSTILIAVAWLLLGVSAAQAQTEVILFKLTSQAAVYNNPSQRTMFRLDRTAYLTKMFTYHWNNGRGAGAGRIGLRNAATGQMVGMWSALGTQHMFDLTPGAAWPSRGDGPPMLHWTVQPNVEVPPGTYEIVDSDPGTWASNAEMGNRGCAWVFGIYGGGGNGQVIPSRVATPQVNPQPTYGGNATVNVAGNWTVNDDSFGSFAITQSGSNVNMHYPKRSGRVVGQLRGNIFDGYWIQDFSGRRCANSRDNSSFWGRLIFTFNGDSYTGNWGYCDEAPGAGLRGNRAGGGYGQIVPSPIATPQVHPMPSPTPASGAGHWERGAAEIRWQPGTESNHSDAQPRAGDQWTNTPVLHRLDSVSSNHVAISGHDERAPANAAWGQVQCSWTEPPMTVDPGQMIQLQMQASGEANCYLFAYEGGLGNHSQLAHLGTGRVSATPYQAPDPHHINSDNSKAEFGFWVGPDNIDVYYRYHWVGGSAGVYSSPVVPSPIATPEIRPAAQQGTMSVRITPATQTINSGDKAITTADVTGGTPPYSYAWYNGAKQSPVIKGGVTWTMGHAGPRDIKVVVTDSAGGTAEAHAQIIVREGGT